MHDNDFLMAQERGIRSVYSHAQFMPFNEVGGKIVVDKESTVRMAKDSVTAPSVNVPSIFTTFIDPQVVEILLAVRNSTKIFSEERRGDWADKFTTFPVAEIAGKVTPYTDFTESTTSDVNFEYVTRENFLFQTLIKYGDLEVAETAKAKIDLVSQKQKASATVLAIAHNKFNLYGVSGKKIYGLLNDPNLSASITPISINSKSTWADKTAADQNGAPLIVYNDISKLIQDLMSRNGGLVDDNSPFILGISNKMNTYLNSPNTFGVTAVKLLKENYPNLEIVFLPELSTSAGEMLYLTVPELNGVKTGINAFSEKMFMGRVIPEVSSYKQKVVGGTWGAIIKRPSLVATMLGV